MSRKAIVADWSPFCLRWSRIAAINKPRCSEDWRMLKLYNCCRFMNSAQPLSVSHRQPARACNGRCTICMNIWYFSFWCPFDDLSSNFLLIRHYTHTWKLPQLTDNHWQVQKWHTAKFKAEKNYLEHINSHYCHASRHPLQRVWQPAKTTWGFNWTSTQLILTVR